MRQEPVQILEFLVTFNAVDKTIEITGEDLINHEIRIKQGISMLVFTLETIPDGSGLEAQFPTYPIEWFVQSSKGTMPVGQPECFQVQFFNEKRCTIVDFNTVLDAETNKHPFNVVVAYDGKTYGSDPTIINEPPST